MRKQNALQICGTGSDVGKSVLVSALCRIFLQDGYKVCPFKAQNMALNSFVTIEGGEIGRAQAVQARACKIEPTVDMNPVLIKPSSDKKAQIIIRGKPLRNMTAVEFTRYKNTAKKIVEESYKKLADDYELMVIEGAGSCAEINLKKHDIVNMQMAKIADASVILAADIDKGGVFASIVGTLSLLTKDERKRVKGIVINKFRGDKRLLKSGIDFLEKKTGKPVLGVIPYFRDIKLPDEDSVALEIRSQKSEVKNQKSKVLDIVVVKLPHIANFTDFDALENEPDVNLRYISEKNEFGNPDVIIIPGTKNTIADLIWLKKSGLVSKILSAINHPLSAMLIGICGGYQMLGEKIFDHKKIESGENEIFGLGILPIITTFGKEKILSQVKAKEIATGLNITGYEIHHGRTRLLKNCNPVFKITGRDDFDGAQAKGFRVWGTYLHGVFDENKFRRSFLNRIRVRKGWQGLIIETNLDPDREFDKLANLIRKNIDMKLLYKIIGFPLARE